MCIHEFLPNGERLVAGHKCILGTIFFGLHAMLLPVRFRVEAVVALPLPPQIRT